MKDSLFEDTDFIMGLGRNIRHEIADKANALLPEIKRQWMQGLLKDSVVVLYPGDEGEWVPEGDDTNLDYPWEKRANLINIREIEK